MPVGIQPPGDGDSPEAVCQRCARKNGVAYVDPLRILLDPQAFATIPLVLQCEYGVLPVKRHGETLYVAVGELSGRTRDRLESFTGLKVVLCLALPDRFPEARRRVALGATDDAGSD